MSVVPRIVPGDSPREISQCRFVKFRFLLETGLFFQRTRLYVSVLFFLFIFHEKVSEPRQGSSRNPKIVSQVKFEHVSLKYVVPVSLPFRLGPAKAKQRIRI